MPVTKDQAHALAALAIAARPHGARKWDGPGIVAAIEKVANLALADVACAVMRAAADRTLETPAAIGNTTSSAWRERVAERSTPRPATPATACWTCGRVLSATCCDNPQRRHDTKPADASAWAEKAREGLR